MKLTCYNLPSAENAFDEIRRMIGEGKAVNIEYDYAKKPATAAQNNFVWGALVSQIRDYIINDMGFNVDDEQVMLLLYDKVADILPEMVVDGGFLKLRRDYVKTLSKMDRELKSKFIDCVFTVIDTDPMFGGLKLTPDVRYNWVFHITDVDKEQVSRCVLPERDASYLDYVREQPCIICGLQRRSHAHHTKIGRLIGVGLKPEDFRAIPLCPEHHLNGAHKFGNEWLENNMKFITSRMSLDEFNKFCYCRWKYGVGIRKLPD